MTDQARRFLVVLRCGDNSFHPSWLALESGERNWDLHLSYYGDNLERYGGDLRGESISFEKGSKYYGLFDYIASHRDQLSRYDLVAFPDDDLQWTTGNFSQLFEILAQTGAALAQPSLDPRSFFSHHLAVRRRRFYYREVDFVEVMCPVFKVDFLFDLIPHLKLNQSSWGLDFVWSKLAADGGRKMAVVDSCCLLHTRRVGKGGQYDGRAMHNLHGELHQALETHGLKLRRGQALAAWTRNGPSKEPMFLVNREECLPLIYRLTLKLMKLNVIGV